MTDSYEGESRLAMTRRYGKRNPSLARAAIAASLVWMGAAEARGAGAEPPQPNPANPVNYIEWFNKAVGGSVSESAHAEYLAVYAEWNLFIGKLDAALNGPWEDLPTVTGWLASNEAALAKFRSAARKTDCYFPMKPPAATGNPRVDGLLFRVEFPKFAAHFNAAQALIAEGYHAWKRGDQRLLIDNALTVLRGARHLEGIQVLMGRLTANRCSGLSYAALRNAMRRSDKPEEIAVSILHELRKADSRPKPLQTFFRTEQIILWDIIQRLFVPGPEPGTRGLDDSLFDTFTQQLSTKGLKPDDRQTLMRIGFEASLREIDAYFAALDQWCKEPYPKAVQTATNVGGLALNSKNPLLRALLPSFSRARALDEGHSAARNATYLIAHLLVFRGRNGSFPEKLDELPAGEVAPWRTDPFSARDFVYKKQGNGFLLYSVGEDGRDDSGVHSESMKDGDYIFWPFQDRT